MTLRWTETASDCRMVAELTPLIQGKIFYANGRWYRNSGESWDQVTKKSITLYINDLRDRIPETPYWSRTRHRMSVAHGLHQIVNNLERACMLGVVRGFKLPPTAYKCLCGRQDRGCYYEP